MTPANAMVAPFGSWASPFSIDRLTDRVVFLSEARGVDGVRWWLEGRPDEDGRQVLVRRELDGTLTRLTPEGFNARSRVHEYGGAAVLISGDLVVVSDFVTGRLNRVVAPGRVEPLTPDGAGATPTRSTTSRATGSSRCARITRTRWSPATASGTTTSSRSISRPASVSVLAEGSDFYAAPRLSPDGSTLVWLEWHHPNMPWDGTELHARFRGRGWRPRAVAHRRRQPVGLDQPAPLGARWHALLRRRARTAG